MDNQKAELEYDISDEVWHVYQKVYIKEHWSFWGKIDMGHPILNETRRYAYIDKKIMIILNSMNTKVS